MAREKKKYWFLVGLIFFIVYFFTASPPIPVETILIPRWLSSLESNYPLNLAGGDESGKHAGGGSLIPFEADRHFGYVDEDGRFIINRIKQDFVSISDAYWAEYEAIPSSVEIKDFQDQTVLTIEEEAYPFFLDGRIFLINEEGTSLRAMDSSGHISWAYDFAAPLTDIDAAAGLLLAGSLDGTVELLDERGKRIFFFEPGGSRLSVIAGCRISRDGSRLAIISGYDDQRFLLLERFGDSYKVIFHEFLSDGFRWAVHMAFIDNDSRVLFERQGGLGIYDIARRNSLYIALPGNVSALDVYGGNNICFVVNSLEGQRKELVAIRFPGSVILQAPFKTDTVFFERRGDRLYIGGGTTIASFDLGKR